MPAHRVLLVYDAKGQYVHPRPGSLLHANPLYRGRITSLLVSEVGAVSVGIGRGALDIYEEILRNKKTSFAPFHARSQELEYQRHFGEAQSLVDTGEAALLKMASDYTECARRDAEEGIPFIRRGRPQIPADRAASHQALLGSGGFDVPHQRNFRRREDGPARALFPQSGRDPNPYHHAARPYRGQYRAPAFWLGCR